MGKYVIPPGSGGTGECVGVARMSDGGVSVLNSNDMTGPRVKYTKREWDVFIQGVKDGEFDL